MNARSALIAAVYFAVFVGLSALIGLQEIIPSLNSGAGGLGVNVARFALVAMPLLLGAALPNLPGRRRPRPLLQLVAVLLGGQVMLSSLVTARPESTVPRAVAVILVLALGCWAVPQRMHARDVTGPILAAYYASSILIVIVLMVVGPVLVPSWGFDGVRYQGPLKATTLGCIPGLLALVALWWPAKPSTAWLHRGVALLAILATWRVGSRAAIAAMAVGLFVLLASRRRHLAVVLVAVAAGGLSCILLAESIGGQAPAILSKARAHLRIDRKDLSTGRVHQYSQVLVQFQDRPVLGAGLGSTVTEENGRQIGVHSLVFAALLCLGLPGAVLVCALWTMSAGALVRDLVVEPPGPHDLVPLQLACVLGYLVFNQFEAYLLYPVHGPDILVIVLMARAAEDVPPKS